MLTNSNSPSLHFWNWPVVAQEMGQDIDVIPNIYNQNGKKWTSALVLPTMHRNFSSFDWSCLSFGRALGSIFAFNWDFYWLTNQTKPIAIRKFTQSDPTYYFDPIQSNIQSDSIRLKKNCQLGGLNLWHERITQQHELLTTPPWGVDVIGKWHYDMDSLLNISKYGC